jgi:spore coat protein U-like protein
MRRLVFLVLGVLLCISAPQRQAAALCAVCSCGATASGAAFGTYNPLQATSRTTTGTVSVTCSLIGISGVIVSYQIALSAGNSGSYSARRLKAGTAQLAYNLYMDSAHSRVWGNGTGGSVVVSDSYHLAAGPGTMRSYTVYGQIPANQNVPAGAYADTIIATVTY